MGVTTTSRSRELPLAALGTVLCVLGLALPWASFDREGYIRTITGGQTSVLAPSAESLPPGATPDERLALQQQIVVAGIIDRESQRVTDETVGWEAASGGQRLLLITLLSITAFSLWSIASRASSAGLVAAGLLAAGILLAGYALVVNPVTGIPSLPTDAEFQAEIGTGLGRYLMGVGGGLLALAGGYAALDAQQSTRSAPTGAPSSGG